MNFVKHQTYSQLDLINYKKETRKWLKEHGFLNPSR